MIYEKVTKDKDPHPALFSFGILISLDMYHGVCKKSEENIFFKLEKEKNMPLCTMQILFQTTEPNSRAIYSLYKRVKKVKQCYKLISNLVMENKILFNFHRITYFQYIF